MSEDRIDVKITASQVVQYSQTIKMRVSDYEKYQKLVAENADDEEFEELAERYLDLSDISDADSLEDIEVSVKVPRS